VRASFFSADLTSFLRVFLFFSADDYHHELPDSRIDPASSRSRDPYPPSLERLVVFWVFTPIQTVSESPVFGSSIEPRTFLNFALKWFHFFSQFQLKSRAPPPGRSVPIISFLW